MIDSPHRNEEDPCYDPMVLRPSKLLALIVALPACSNSVDPTGECRGGPTSRSCSWGPTAVEVSGDANSARAVVQLRSEVPSGMTLGLVEALDRELWSRAQSLVGIG